MMNAFHSLHFQVIKCAATFALLGDVDFKRNGDVAIWCILNTTSISSPLLCIIKICACIYTGDTIRLINLYCALVIPVVIILSTQLLFFSTL